MKDVSRVMGKFWTLIGFGYTCASIHQNVTVYLGFVRFIIYKFYIKRTKLS